ASLVWQKLPEVHFVFVGPAVGTSEKIFQAVVDARVHRLGSVSLQDKTDAIAACDLLCVPSMQESFGGVYTEAWSFAKPVIGGKISAIMDVIEDGVDGYVVNQEASEIADRICHLLQHPSQAQALGRAGQQKVLENYTWERLGQKTEQVYLHTLSAN
ncbi:MAG TPA: glycosyltransferase family 4 protein, partial [Trichocoleus sp.]